MTNDCINIEEDGDIVRGEKVLVWRFNENYINIVKISSTALLTNLYHNISHPSVQKIKREFSIDKEFELTDVSARDINQIIKSLNTNKAKVPDGISLKFVKISADIIDSYIASIINKDISNKKFSENSKTATVRPIFKKGYKTEIKDYRPVSLLIIFSKIY